MECHLVSLGSGRFCVAMTCLVPESTGFLGGDSLPEPRSGFTVLTGIEVVRIGEGGRLWMVKHKSKRYMFTDDCRKTSAAPTRSHSAALTISKRTAVEIELKMNRRFVNLVTANYNSRMYSLRRMDVSKHLFYPSTSEAEAAAEAANEEDSNGGKAPRIEKLRRLPQPSLRLQSCLGEGVRWPCDTFSLLSPDGGGRILHTNGGGNAVLCDVQSACSIENFRS
ncbi:hypothetical protein EJB05_15233, partial [Eragrostis curvula]